VAIPIPARPEAAVTESRGERAFPYLLLLPAAIALALVSIYPLYMGVQASLTHYVFGRPVGSADFTNYAGTPSWCWSSRRSLASG
jgi:ABC-type sugar transport system permease subunit